MANDPDTDQPVKLPADDDVDAAAEGDDTVVAEDEHDGAAGADDDDDDDDGDDDGDDDENKPTPLPGPSAAAGGAAAAGSSGSGPPEFVWRIDNWSRSETRVFSEPFTMGTFQWRMLAFPRGNNVDSLSLFLEVYNHPTLPPGWHRSAHFTLTLRNQRCPERSQARDETHVFFSREADWGFQQFIKLRDLNDEAQGYCVNDSVIITAQVQVLTDQELAGRKVAGTWQRYLPPYDSKKETGFVGLKNQGATCYMNSLLQALYHLGSFRRAVYQMPTENEESPEKSIPLALQRVFHRLQFSDQGVSTKELTKSFGWDAYDSFTQHDVQELNRVLCDNLEGKMKTTPAEGTIERHFQGKLVNFIKCVNVDFESTREEAFYDLSLNVKDVKDLYASFQKYVEVEMLDGPNQYMAEGYGLQDAKMGCRIKSLPPVLELQLKRFEYNPMVDAMCKINDKFIFPPEIDLSDFLAEDADRSHPPIYHLYAVLVHSGDVYGGHYYAFIKPTTGPQWYKFDDDRVTAATAENAIDDNFGGEQLMSTTNYRGERIVMKHKKYANAYMLIYVRAQDIDEILGPVTGEDIPSYLRDIFEGEAAKDEQKRKDKAEAHLFVNIKPTFAENYLEANSDPFELLDITKERSSFRVKKTSTLAEFKQVLIKEQLPNVVPERIRFWIWTMRDNKTIRPQRLISSAEEAKPISYIRQSSMDDWKLYVEVGPEVADEDGSFFPAGNLTFFKFYDPETQSISRVGTALVDEHKYLHEILDTMRKLKGLPDGCSLECFEEFKPGQIDTIRPDSTLGTQRLGAGDIIIFQLSPPDDQLDTSSRFGLAPNYLTYLFNRITIECYSYEKPTEKQFEIELSKRDLYEAVSHAITAKLNLPNFHVRFYPHSGLQGPRRTPIKYSPVVTLSEMLMSMYSRNVTPIIYYESLECDVRELESKKSLKLAFLDDNNKLISEVRVLVPKDSKISYVIQVAKEKLPEPIDASVPYRACETFSNRISRTFRDTESVSLLDEQNIIIAEPIAAVEAEFKPGDRLIPVCHAQLDGSIVRPFGFPFMFPLFAGEPFATTKARLQAKLQVEDEEFAKWRFGLASFGALITIQDIDILAKRDFASMTFLAMMHTNKNAKKDQRFRRAEKAIKIYN